MPLFQNFSTYSIGQVKVAKVVPAKKEVSQTFSSFNGGSIFIKVKTRPTLLS
jgi:glutamine amidotransferase-like uncharacterized protein